MLQCNFSPKAQVYHCSVRVNRNDNILSYFEQQRTTGVLGPPSFVAVLVPKMKRRGETMSCCKPESHEPYRIKCIHRGVLRSTNRSKDRLSTSLLIGLLHIFFCLLRIDTSPVTHSSTKCVPVASSLLATKLKRKSKSTFLKPSQTFLFFCTSTCFLVQIVLMWLWDSASLCHLPKQWPHSQPHKASLSPVDKQKAAALTVPDFSAPLRRELRIQVLWSKGMF